MSWITPLATPSWEPIDTRPGHNPYEDEEEDKLLTKV